MGHEKGQDVIPFLLQSAHNLFSGLLTSSLSVLVFLSVVALSWRDIVVAVRRKGRQRGAVWVSSNFSSLSIYGRHNLAATALGKNFNKDIYYNSNESLVELQDCKRENDKENRRRKRTVRTGARKLCVMRRNMTKKKQQCRQSIDRRYLNHLYVTYKTRKPEKPSEN
jgi:hypothetical protein